MEKCVKCTAFSPFPTMFSTLPNTNFNFSIAFIVSSANAFNLDHFEIFMFGNELTEQGLCIHFSCQSDVLCMFCPVFSKYPENLCGTWTTWSQNIHD